MAGAARRNKGLGLVAGLASLWAAEGRTIPLVVQVSKKHVNRHGRRERALVDSLLFSGYPGLRADSTEPDRAAYAARFRGAIVLAPYEREPFVSQVGGVVLDALLHGAPVVTTRGTWPGNQVERFGAGVTIGERSVRELAAAVDRILSEWPAHAARACEASAVLAREHDPLRLLETLSKETSAT
jgi:glycosyltransferase involved in cell wall biosynthesis